MSAFRLSPRFAAVLVAVVLAAVLWSGRALAAPAIALVAPADGQSVSGPLDVRVRIDGFKLDGTKIGTPPADGVGHWHVYVDGKYAGLSVSDVVTIPNDALPEIPAGRHEIKVQLHNNDHTPVAGDIIAARTVNFTQDVKYTPAGGDSPSIKIMAPSDGVQLSTSGDNLIRVQVGGFKMDGTKIGTPPAQGVGHWHLYVDGKYAGLSVSDSIALPNDAMPEIAPGRHELKVQLHNNDHTPVAGDITSAITVNFAAGSAAQGAATPSMPRTGAGLSDALPPAWWLLTALIAASGAIAWTVAWRSRVTRSD